MLELTLLSEQLDLYRLQRHDFMNHWQVIMGYLQLGNTDKALNYMRNALQGLEAEQVMGQIPQPIVASCLLGFVVSLRSQGVQVQVEVSESIKEADFWEEFWQEEYGQALYGYTRGCLSDFQEHIVKLEQAKALLLLKATEGFMFYIRLLITSTV